MSRILGGLYLSLSLLAIFLFSSVTAFGTAPAAALQASGSDVTLTLGGTSAVYNFGVAHLRAAQSIEHIFTIRNVSASTVSISALHPSCGCTTAMLDQGSLPLTLKPGAQVPVRVVVDASMLAAGAIRKSVLVYSNGSEEPAVTLEMVGTLLPQFYLSRALLDFHNVAFGHEKKIDFSIAIDPTMPDANVPIKIVCSNPDIRIISAHRSSIPHETGTGVVMREYDAIVSPHARLGLLTGEVTVQSIADLGSNKHQIFATVPLAGTVIGDLSSAPGELAFGVVPVGTSKCLSIVIESATPIDPPKILTRRDKYVSCVMRTSMGNGIRKRTESRVFARQSKHFVLDVTLKPVAPVGSISSEIEVSSKSERLVLPVSGYVTSTATGL